MHIEVEVTESTNPTQTQPKTNLRMERASGQEGLPLVSDLCTADSPGERESQFS